MDVLIRNVVIFPELFHYLLLLQVYLLYVVCFYLLLRFSPGVNFNVLSVQRTNFCADFIYVFEKLFHHRCQEVADILGLLGGIKLLNGFDALLELACKELCWVFGHKLH